jgi:hypothetical protein
MEHILPHPDMILAPFSSAFLFSQPGRALCQ